MYIITDFTSFVQIRIKIWYPLRAWKTFVYTPTSYNFKICALFFLIILLYDNSNIRIIMFFLLFHFPLLFCCKDRECRTRGFCICGPAVPADDSLRTQEIIDGPLGVTRFATAQYISLCHCEPVLRLAWQSPDTLGIATPAWALVRDDSKYSSFCLR